jgi:hypothetical protein
VRRGGGMCFPDQELSSHARRKSKLFFWICYFSSIFTQIPPWQWQDLIIIFFCRLSGEFFFKEKINIPQPQDKWSLLWTSLSMVIHCLYIFFQITFLDKTSLTTSLFIEEMFEDNIHVGPFGHIILIPSQPV